MYLIVINLLEYFVTHSLPTTRVLTAENLEDAEKIALLYKQKYLSTVNEITSLRIYKAEEVSFSEQI